MKINIVFPYNLWGGAFRSTYELANRMAARGEDVHIYTPFFPYLNGESVFSRDGMKLLTRGLGRSIVRRNRVPWFDLRVPYSMVPVISDRFVRDADVILANHWQTAASVAALSPSKGRKFCFVRDVDPWSKYYQRELTTFRLPLTHIALATWLREFLEREIGIQVAGVVPNGTNMDQFRVEHKTPNEPPVVTMIYAEHPAKGMPDGLAALKQVKARHPEVTILIFGWKKPINPGFDFEFHHRPVKDRLRALYARSDIFLFPSVQEGSGNPPREAMAAQCALVTTNVGCVPDCTIPGETALVVEPGDVQGMVDGICRLIEDRELRVRLGRAGYDYIQQFTWEQATARLLEILKQAPAGPARASTARPAAARERVV